MEPNFPDNRRKKKKQVLPPDKVFKYNGVGWMTRAKINILQFKKKN